MAKKRYIVHDELGATWVVGIEDPAYWLVSRLKVPEVVLPRRVLRGDMISFKDIETCTEKVKALGKLATIDDDPDIHSALGWHVSMLSCLNTLVKELQGDKALAMG